MMDDFKNAKTLYDEYKGKPRDTRHAPRELLVHKVIMCEYHDPRGCMTSIEAVKLGLTKAVQLCNGRISTLCSVRTRLAAGATIKELYTK